MLSVIGFLLWASYDVNILQQYPHDTTAFTQGLYYDNGVLYESIGLYGHSALRKVELATGNVLQQKQLPHHLFAEGMTVWNDKIYLLTWRKKIGFIFDKKTFQQLGTFRYATEGWGLTHDPQHLIMSDGSAKLFFLDPDTFHIKRTLTVIENHRPVRRLNELEYVNGEIYANVWRRDWIVVIDAKTGQVKRRLILKNLLSQQNQPKAGVLNGIAYDKVSQNFFITGKLWPTLFVVKWLKRN